MLTGDVGACKAFTASWNLLYKPRGQGHNIRQLLAFSALFPSQKPGSMTQKVLLIEADAESRQAYSEALRAANLSVSTAKDGPTGMLVFRNIAPEIVVSNMVLGEMTAVDICEKIRNAPNGNKIQIILLSNSPRSAKYIEGISSKYRVAHFLQKPLPAAELIRVIKNMVGGNGAGAAATVDAHTTAGTRRSPLPKYFPGLLLYYSDRKATGILSLRKEAQEKTVYLERGTVVGIDSNLKGEQLGKVLVEKGVITEGDYLKAAQTMVEDGIQLGEALVKLDLISQPVLDELVSDHQIYKIAGCFLWFDAELKFQDIAALPAIKNKAAVPLERIFQMGMGALKKTPNLAKVLTPILNEYVTPNELYDRHRSFLGFTDAQLLGVDRLGKGYQLEEVLTPDNESVMVLLYLTGMLEVSQPKIDVLKERIHELKGQALSGNQELAKQLLIDREEIAKLQHEAEARAKKHQDEINRLITDLHQTQEALAKTKQSASQTVKEREKASSSFEKLQEDIKKMQAELNQTRDEIRTSKEALQENNAALRRAQEEKAAIEKNYRDLQAQLLEAEKARAQAERQTAPAAPKPAAAPTPVLDASEPGQDFFADLPLETTAPPPAAPSPEMFDLAGGDLGGGDLADLAGTSIGQAAPLQEPSPLSMEGLGDGLSDNSLSESPDGFFDLAGLEAPSGESQPSMESTIAMAKPAAPAAPPSGDGIFDLAGTELSAALEGDGPTANPDSTIMMQAPIPEPPAAAAPDLSGLDGELDQVFDQFEATEPPPPPAAVGLPIDPFAPQNVREGQPENAPPPPPPPPPKDEFEEFFGVPQK